MSISQKIIRCIIIDDEPGNIVTLTELIKEYCPQIIIAGSAPDIITGREIIEKTSPDLVFLDIEMPFGNAFDLLDKLAPIKFEIIFITAFNNYALKAIKYAALDYILKPVNIDELKNAVKKAIDRIEEKNINSRINYLLTNLRPENQAVQKIGLPTREGFYFEDVNNLMYLKAEGSYTSVFINSKRKELVSRNLKEFEDILPENNFCRVHHSYIINTSFVKKYYKGRGGYVEMEDGTAIEIAVRKKDAFLAKFRL